MVSPCVFPRDPDLAPRFPRARPFSPVRSLQFQIADTRADAPTLFVPAPEACHIIVEELVDALHAKRAKLHRKLTPDEATTVLERACVTVRSEYGLQMRNNAVTPVYSKHQAVARAEGNWISIFLINVCAQVVGEHEKAIVRGAFDAATSVNDLRARACQRGDAEEEEEEDEDGGAGLGVCPEDVDWSRVNTHDDGWSSSSLPTQSKDGKEL